MPSWPCAPTQVLHPPIRSSSRACNHQNPGRPQLLPALDAERVGAAVVICSNPHPPPTVVGSNPQPLTRYTHCPQVLPALDAEGVGVSVVRSAGVMLGARHGTERLVNCWHGGALEVGAIRQQIRDAIQVGCRGDSWTAHDKGRTCSMWLLWCILGGSTPCGKGSAWCEGGAGGVRLKRCLKGYAGDG